MHGLQRLGELVEFVLCDSECVQETLMSLSLFMCSQWELLDLPFRSDSLYVGVVLGVLHVMRDYFRARTSLAIAIEEPQKILGLVVLWLCVVWRLGARRETWDIAATSCMFSLVVLVVNLARILPAHSACTDAQHGTQCKMMLRALACSGFPMSLLVL